MQPINTIDFTSLIGFRIRQKSAWRKAFSHIGMVIDLCLNGLEKQSIYVERQCQRTVKSDRVLRLA